MIILTPSQRKEWRAIVEKIIAHEIQTFNPPGPFDRLARAALTSFVSQKAIQHIEPSIRESDE